MKIICQHVIHEGIIEVYVQHLTIDDLRNKFKHEVMLCKTKGIILEEILNEHQNDIVSQVHTQEPLLLSNNEIEMKLKHEKLYLNEDFDLCTS